MRKISEAGRGGKKKHREIGAEGDGKKRRTGTVFLRY
jgi:hypothetical protein